MFEPSFTTTLSQGMRGKRVREIQEWLCLHGYHLVVDGDFGPATRRAVAEFQEQNDLPVGGKVTRATFAELLRPMTRATSAIDPGNRSLGRLVVAYAKQHLAEHPREVGGQNRGPWVRLYMNGKEGEQWPWCAGFVSYVLRQACSTAGASRPVSASFSCDVLAMSARENGCFLAESAVGSRDRIPPGSIFLNRRTSTDWVHTGFVTGVESDVFHTIEGNTNDEGSREGYEVCARFRGYAKKDFVAIP
jgi:hypothetical protein